VNPFINKANRKSASVRKMTTNDEGSKWLRKDFHILFFLLGGFQAAAHYQAF
jgi:hypothetical protein